MLSDAAAGLPVAENMLRATPEPRLGSRFRYRSDLGEKPQVRFLDRNPLTCGKLGAEAGERVALMDRLHLCRIAQVVTLAVWPRAVACQSPEIRAGPWICTMFTMFRFPEKIGVGIIAAPRADPNAAAARLDGAARRIRGGCGLRDPIIFDHEKHRQLTRAAILDFRTPAPDRAVPSPMNVATIPRLSRCAEPRQVRSR